MEKIKEPALKEVLQLLDKGTYEFVFFRVADKKLQLRVAANGKTLLLINQRGEPRQFSCSRIWP